MLAAYGVDVLDPQVSTRRVHVLLERLPPWSRLPGEQWSVEAELLAALIDHVAQLTYVTLKAAGAKGATQPTAVRRPPRRLGPRPPAQQPADPRAEQQFGPGKTASWADAVKRMSVMPGVVISDG
jgi:hypothetical protein